MYFDRKIKSNIGRRQAYIPWRGAVKNGAWIYAGDLLVGSVRGVNGIFKLIFCMFFLCGLAAGLQQYVHHPGKKYRVVDVFYDILCLGRSAVFNFTSGDDFCRVVLRAEDRMVPRYIFAYRFFYPLVRGFGGSALCF